MNLQSGTVRMFGAVFQHLLLQRFFKLQFAAALVANLLGRWRNICDLNSKLWYTILDKASHYYSDEAVIWTYVLLTRRWLRLFKTYLLACFFLSYLGLSRWIFSFEFLVYSQADIQFDMAKLLEVPVFATGFFFIRPCETLWPDNFYSGGLS